jgi:gamma-polyglutamate biosynthesis protein CapC
MTALTPHVAVLGLAVGIICALLVYLRTRLSPGGLLTPGWLAVAAIWKPTAALVVLGAGALTFLGVVVARRYMILYGDRLLAASLLLGVLFDSAWYLVSSDSFPPLYSFAALGLVVPGWLAYQLSIQPLRPTLLTTGLATVVSCGVLGAVVAVS